MRIFTGVALDEEVKKGLLRELQPFRKTGAPIRWTAESSLHLTLRFIGEVAESLAERVGEALLAAPAAAFRLRLRGFGKFPAGDELHVFWAGVEESPGLRALFTGIEDALARLGIGRDTRPFHPHLTLGRNRALSGRHGFREIFSLLQEKGDLFLGEWDVKAYRLFSSRLAAAGPMYSVLKEIPLVQS